MKAWMKENKYCFVLLYFVFYLIAFRVLEKWVIPKYMVHCFLDQWIPFCEVFILPYFSWFILLAGTLAYYMFMSKEDFLKLCFIMFNGMTFCIVIYALLPNGLELRTELPRDNLFCKGVEWLYRIDTATNVCPSIHVSSTIAIYEVSKRSKLFKNKRIIRGLWIWSVLICLSTVFLKQHSVIDVVLGYLLSIVLTQCIYHTQWAERMTEVRLKK